MESGRILKKESASSNRTLRVAANLAMITGLVLPQKLSV